MRYLIALLMSICLCLNAAHVAASGVHEAFEHGAANPLVAMFFESHEHPHGHHGTNHEPDMDDITQAHADHNHAHTPLFTLVPSMLASLPDEYRHVMALASCDTLVSVAQARLERPPRLSRA